MRPQSEVVDGDSDGVAASSEETAGATEAGADGVRNFFRFERFVSCVAEAPPVETQPSHLNLIRPPAQPYDNTQRQPEVVDLK